METKLYLVQPQDANTLPKQHHLYIIHAICALTLIVTNQSTPVAKLMYSFIFALDPKLRPII